MALDELIARIEALEARKLVLKDLPLAPLQRKLETDWQPSAPVLLGEHSITPAMLSAVFGGITAVSFGTSAVVFTASADSAQVTVPHGLGKLPLAVFTTPAIPVAARISVQESAAADVTNVYLKGFQSSTAVITATQNFYWLVVA